jgi:hypothetical protein
MKKPIAILIGGMIAGTVAVLWFRRSAQSTRLADVHLTTNDLDYPDVSPQDLTASHLIDLNDASQQQLEILGLAPDSLARLIDNRPYRSKLELVSRMVLSEAEYEAIREKVGVAQGREPVKIA